MKKLFASLLVIVMAVCTLFAFTGCDSIAPSGSLPDTGDVGGNQGSGSGDDTEENPNEPLTQWSYDDDYHWHTEADKAPHTRENGACTVCGTNHTVGLEYQLSTESTAENTSVRSATLLVDSENKGGYYVITGIGDATETDIVIPSAYNGLPVKEIGDNAFSYLRGYETDKRPDYVLRSVVIPKSIEKIGSCVFHGSPVKVYYSGSEEEYALINKIKYENVAADFEISESAVLYFYTQTRAAEGSGYYWYYDDNGEIAEAINYVGLKRKKVIFWLGIATGAATGVQDVWISYLFEYGGTQYSFNDGIQNYMEVDIEITSYDGNRFGAKLSSQLVLPDYPSDVRIDIGEWDLQWDAEKCLYTTKFFDAQANIGPWDNEASPEAVDVTFGAEIEIGVSSTGKCSVRYTMLALIDRIVSGIGAATLTSGFYLDIDRFIENN